MAPLAAMAAGPVAKLSQLGGRWNSVATARGGRYFRATSIFSQAMRCAPALRWLGAKLSSQASGEIRDLGASTHLRVVEAGIEVLAGSGLGGFWRRGGRLLAGVENKFATSQRYTTVRRP